MLLSKATYSAFRLYIFLSVHAFPGNRTHNLCAANAMLYHWATGTQRLIYVGQICCGLMRPKFNFFPVTSGVKQTQHFIKRTSYQQSNMVVVVWRRLLCSFRIWMIRHNWWNHEFCTLSERRMFGHQFVTSSSSTLGLCSRTMIPTKTASPPLNGSRKTKLRFWSGQIKVRLRCCGMTLNGPFLLEKPPMWLN